MNLNDVFAEEIFSLDEDELEIKLSHFNRVDVFNATLEKIDALVAVGDKELPWKLGRVCGLISLMKGIDENVCMAISDKDCISGVFYVEFLCGFWDNSPPALTAVSNMLDIATSAFALGVQDCVDFCMLSVEALSTTYINYVGLIKSSPGLSLSLQEFFSSVNEPVMIYGKDTPASKLLLQIKS